MFTHTHFLQSKSSLRPQSTGLSSRGQALRSPYQARRYIEHDVHAPMTLENCDLETEHKKKTSSQVVGVVRFCNLSAFPVVLQDERRETCMDMRCLHNREFSHNIDQV